VIDLCEQKNSFDKPCPRLVSAGEENPKPEHRHRRGKPPTPDGQKFSVYALTENGKMRYIGLTSQTLPRRLNQHFQDMNRPNRKEHKTNWLRACKRGGVVVKIKSLRRGLCLESAQRIEKQIIKRLRPQLVNVHEGGSSGYNGLPPDAKARHSASGKARYLDPKQIENAKKFSKLAHAAKARKRMENPPDYIPRPQEGLLLKTIRITDELAGSSFEIKLRQGKRLNQVIAETFGRCSKPHGMDFLTRFLRKRLVTRWATTCLLFLCLNVQAMDIASWERHSDKGQIMANGQQFNPNAMTCASRIHPIGTFLRVSDVHNGLFVIVRVTDRPSKQNASRLDLTPKAFSVLNGLQLGICEVRVDILKKPNKVGIAMIRPKAQCKN